MFITELLNKEYITENTKLIILETIQSLEKEIEFLKQIILNHNNSYIVYHTPYEFYPSYPNTISTNPITIIN